MQNLTYTKKEHHYNVNYANGSRQISNRILHQFIIDAGLNIKERHVFADGNYTDTEQYPVDAATYLEENEKEVIEAYLNENLI
jgi:hypothetical protein